MSSRLSSLLFAVACIAVAACHSVVPEIGVPVPAAHTEWPMALAQASTDATSGRYGAAERILTDFASKYPATNEATEAMFWRALYKLDPANPNAASHEAAALLDSYMLAPQPEHRNEGMALRRIAAALEARPTLAVAVPPTATVAPRVEDKIKDDEIQRLKDELAKTTAELERIKRRLAAPKP